MPFCIRPGSKGNPTKGVFVNKIPFSRRPPFVGLPFSNRFLQDEDESKCGPNHERFLKHSPTPVDVEELEGMNVRDQVIGAETEDPAWRPLYRIGATAALIVAAFIPIQGFIFFNWPPPTTVIGWFALFQSDPLIGLLDMDLLLTIDYLLLIPVFLALWAELKQVNQSLMAIALVLQLVSITTYFASTAAFEMLGLSKQHAAATMDAERSTFLAAGQAMLSTWQGTAFDVSYIILGAIALLTVSAVMLRSKVFSKPTAYLGLVAGVLMTVPPSAGMIGIIVSFLSLLPTIPWLILVARRLFQLARGRPVSENRSE